MDDETETRIQSILEWIDTIEFSATTEEYVLRYVPGGEVEFRATVTDDREESIRAMRIRGGQVVLIEPPLPDHIPLEAREEFAIYGVFLRFADLRFILRHLEEARFLNPNLLAGFFSVRSLDILSPRLLDALIEVLEGPPPAEHLDPDHFDVETWEKLQRRGNSRPRVQIHLDDNDRVIAMEIERILWTDEPLALEFAYLTRGDN